MPVSSLVRGTDRIRSAGTNAENYLVFDCSGGRGAEEGSECGRVALKCGQEAEIVWVNSIKRVSKSCAHLLMLRERGKVVRRSEWAKVVLW